MIHALLFLAMIWMAFLGLRLIFIFVKGIFGAIAFILAVTLIVVVVVTQKSSSPVINSDQSNSMFEQTLMTKVDCSDVDQVLAGALGASELCDRYYKGEQCRREIEEVFTRFRLKLSPIDLCGGRQTSAFPELPLPKSFDQQAVEFRSSITDEEYSQWIEKLHAVNSGQSSISLVEIRPTPLLATFVAFEKPSGDALQRIAGTEAQRLGGVVLESVPLLTPFSGIVRGVYEKNERQECTVRIRDHSLCIQRKDYVTCNVLDWTIGPHEQICVDYLVR